MPRTNSSPDRAAAALENGDFAVGALVGSLADLPSRGVMVIDDPHVAASPLAELATGGVRILLKPRSTRAARKQTVYMTIARAWGLEPVPRAKAGARFQGQLKPRCTAASVIAGNAGLWTMAPAARLKRVRPRT